jgi:Xaa-Pro aminopeptidase
MLPRLLNLTRARELMARDGVDAVVAQLPINVYYLSGYWGFLMAAERFDAAYFAVLPRAADRPASLVLPSLELRRVAGEGGVWMDELQAFSSPLDEDEAAEAGRPYDGWPVRAGVNLLPRERSWVEAVAGHRHRVAASALHALARAGRSSGLEGARIVTDDARVSGWLEAHGLAPASVRYDPSFFNAIRMIKTAPEIELMRSAALKNERAMLAAVDGLAEGARWEEIETIYMTEMARQGGRGVYCICGVGGLPAGEVRRGEPVLFDALGQYRRYHGDFGRSAVLGEPTAEHRRRFRALQSGWEAILPLIRPGVRYSELAARALQTVRRSGFPEFRYVTPHGLGLEHTDDPKPLGVQLGTKPDQVLEPGMVINVDMPYTEIGWGSLHLEDTVLVTADGHELLTTADLGLRCVPG